MASFRGVLYYYNEGSCWAFQDEKFMGLDDKARRCTRCGLIWEDYEQDEPDMLPFSEISHDESSEFSLWARISNDSRTACLEHGHSWTLQFPNGRWSYEGLYILNEDDRLSVGDPVEPSRIVWAGCWSDIKQIDRQIWSTWFKNEYPATLQTSDD